MSVKYSWNRQNGAAMPSVRFMSIEPAEDYYKGMPLKLKEKGIVEPTDGDPEYICMAEYNPDAEIQPLEIPVQEVFPDVVYDRMNDDGTIEEVRFGSKGGGGVQSDMYETDPNSMAFVKNNPIEKGTGSFELKFDGSLDDKTYKQAENTDMGLPGVFVKMSDDVPDDSGLISIGVVEITETIFPIEPSMIVDLEEFGISGSGVTPGSIMPFIFIVRKYSPETTYGVALEPGIWFFLIDASAIGGEGYIGASSLKYNAEAYVLKTALLPLISYKTVQLLHLDITLNELIYSDWDETKKAYFREIVISLANGIPAKVTYNNHQVYIMDILFLDQSNLVQLCLYDPIYFEGIFIEDDEGAVIINSREMLQAAAAVPNAAGETVTASEFNALLTSLRNGRVIKP